MKAECIGGFSIEQHDDNGFLVEDSYFRITKGTIWDVDEETFRLIGGEVRLINDDLCWLEIPNETFFKFFKIIN